MKKITPVLFTLIVLFMLCNGLFAQKGEPILKVYSDFYKGLRKEDRSTALEVKRVYLGYKGNINEHFSAEAKLDIGSPEDLSQYSLIRRYAYFKTAELKYKKDRLTLRMGLFSMLQFKLQEKTWGYRYIYKSFQDEHKIGPSADIGFGAEYQFNDFLKADLVFSNGEGYKNLQSDNSYKTSIGFTINPFNNTTLRLYYDFMKKDVLQSTIAFFVSYQQEKYRLSYEFIKALNRGFNYGNDLDGMSVYGTYLINDKWEVFARYDRLASSIDPETSIPWNILNDGSAVITGIEYNVHDNINLSLNYRDWYSYAKNGPDQAYLYLNLEFKL